MRCCDCANLDYEVIDNMMVALCRVQYVPPCANTESEERQCDKFIPSSGKSKWECMSEEERDVFKKCALEYASKNYSGAEVDEFIKYSIMKAKTTDNNCGA